MKVLAVVMVCLTALVGLVAIGVITFERSISDSIVVGCANSPPPDMYRLANCTSTGGSLATTAFQDKISEYTVMGGDPGSISVAKTDWHAARLILKDLQRSHPKDFFDEPAGPTEPEGWGAGTDDSAASSGALVPTIR